MSEPSVSYEGHYKLKPGVSPEEYYDPNVEDTSTPCTTWVYSVSATVHVAKNRDLFISYRVFERSTVSVTSSSDGAEPKTWTEEIVGVGNVDTHVLHVPSSMCNILAGAAPGMSNFEIKPLPGATHGERTICDENNRQELKLSGPPVGPVPAPTPPAQLGKLGNPSTTWTDDKDRARWTKKKSRPPGFRVGRRKDAGRVGGTGIKVMQMLFDSDDTEEELERQDRSLFVGHKLKYGDVGMP
ncbi:hypothetical protein QBC37DRAFT_376326 [Rhypophila decipiens]|uniref:Uncharacterized protein n=1 Tax=Rhypophila decipiens TaxID=261697 RepID=A0AAN6Y2D8_9PEZI|nr:hypothetical protein QBC37DRAFT_376326 [Rhypophila decipiens]